MIPPTNYPPQSSEKLNMAVMKANMLASMLAGMMFIIMTVIGTTLNDVCVPLPSNIINALISMSLTPYIRLILAKLQY